MNKIKFLASFEVGGEYYSKGRQLIERTINMSNNFTCPSDISTLVSILLSLLTVCFFGVEPPTTGLFTVSPTKSIVVKKFCKLSPEKKMEVCHRLP